MERKDYDVLIIGGGPAGLTAAIYTCRAGRATGVIDKVAPGGQILLTEALENFPGFPEGVGGADLAQAMEKQARRFGAEIISTEITEISSGEEWTTLKSTGGTEYRCKALIIASGSSPRRIGVPGEEEFLGRGVSTCATCDAFFFRGKDVVVLGGGDTAIEESIFLTKHVNSVRVVHRRDTLRAQKILQERAFSNEKISFEWDSVVASINGDKSVNGVIVKNVKTGETRDIPCDGVFVFIGWDPNTEFVKDLVELDESGFIKVNCSMETSRPGVFAAGEVRAHTARQAISSAGDGATAGINADAWLTETEE